VARNTEEIQALGRELYDRLSTMVGHLDRMGVNIRQSAESYNNLLGSLEQKVLPSARRFKELGVSSTKDVEAPEVLSFELRSPSDRFQTSPRR
jgi:DNA recombination protein RmuC